MLFQFVTNVQYKCNFSMSWCKIKYIRKSFSRTQSTITFPLSLITIISWNAPVIYLYADDDDLKELLALLSPFSILLIKSLKTKK